MSFIQNRPGKAPLTRIAKNFNPESLQGCGSVDSIKNYNDKKICSIGRNHYKRQANNQIIENIKYKKINKYIFKIGV